MKVLIVDDSRVMRNIVLRTLRQAGFEKHEFVEATNGKEGLDIIRAGHIDLVLSDWNMPQMNGIDLLRALRAENNNVDFGFITSEGTTDMRRLAASCGAIFLIVKPFTADDFQNALKNLLR